MGSPRQPFELNQELGNLQGHDQDNHFAFDSDNNPFSFYHEENNRDVHSSEDQNTVNTHKEHNTQKEEQSKKLNAHARQDLVIEEYENHQIGENINNKKQIKIE